jgi:hypothetical protein
VCCVALLTTSEVGAIKLNEKRLQAKPGAS